MYYEEQDSPGYVGGGDNQAGGNGGDPFLDGLTQLYQQYYHRDPTAAEITAHRGNPGGLAAIEKLLKDSMPTETPPPDTTQPPDTATGGGTGGGAPTGGLLDPYTKTYTPPANIDLGGPTGVEYIPPVPEFRPPGYEKPPAFTFEDYTPIAAFKAPTVEEALSDPGYKFRLDQGRQALEGGAAARGVLNSGGTLQDVMDYGQNAASQEYANVWGRRYGEWSANDAASRANYALRRGNAVDTYNTNYGTQYVDPYKFTYQAASDAFAPKMAGWSTLASAGMHQNDLNNANSWAQYLFDWEKFRDQRDSTFSKMFQYANA